MLAPDDLRAVHFDIDTKARPASSSRNGAASGWPGCPSTSSSAPTAASAGRRSSWWPTPRSTATPECTVLLPRRSYAWSGSGSSTTAPPTRSQRSWVRSLTSVPPSPPSPWRPGRAMASAQRSYGRSVQQRARSGRNGADDTETIDAHGRSGVDRIGRKDGPRRPGLVLEADQTLAQRARRRRRRSPPSCRASECGSPAASGPRACSRRPAYRRTSRACSADGTGGLLLSLPGAAEDRRHRARRPPGRRGHGRDVEPPAGHAEPVVRVGAGRPEGDPDRSPEPAPAAQRPPSPRRKTGPLNCPLRRQSLTCPPARRRVRPPWRVLAPGSRHRSRGAERCRITRRCERARLHPLQQANWNRKGTTGNDQSPRRQGRVPGLPPGRGRQDVAVSLPGRRHRRHRRRAAARPQRVGRRPGHDQDEGDRAGRSRRAPRRSWPASSAP